MPITLGPAAAVAAADVGRHQVGRKRGGQGGGGISGQQWRWPKEARKRICENYLCCPSKAWLNFPNASAGHTSHYTHTHTYTLCDCVCCCFIEATSNEFSLILWFDMYGLWGNSPAQALKLLVYFSFLFFLLFYLFQLWKLFTCRQSESACK